MSDNADSRRVEAQKMETNIVFEAPRKSMSQAVFVWLVRTILFLAILVAAGYAFLNLTPAGEEIKEKYEKRCRETVKLLDDGIDFCRFYISYCGQPPVSQEEVIKFQVERMRHPFTQYKLPDGRNLPYWNGKDGFGHEIRIQVNPQLRRIKLTSPGFLPISGNKPAVFDYVREASY